MIINVTVTLDADDNFAYTPEAGAMQVLVALGGNATTDVCYLTLSQNAAGVAGTQPPAPLTNP